MIALRCHHFAMVQKASGQRARATLQQLTLEAWLSAQRSPNARAAYRFDLDTFGKWCALQGVIALTADTATLVAFQNARELAGDRDSTLRRRWSALSSFYNFAVDCDLLASNPVHGVDRPKVTSGDPSPTVLLSKTAVLSYRAAAAALDPRLEALVALLVCDGLKVAEALALDIENIASRPTMITIRRRGESKQIVLDPNTARAMRRCIGKRRSGPVFVNERSSRSAAPNRLTRFGADHLIRQLRTEESTEQVTANALRRFHINARQGEGHFPDDEPYTLRPS